jgi:molecular chaperone DnaJ
MQAKDYYKILGVSESADAAELKKAFRKIARESHPDQHPGDKAAENRFKEASEAYEVLSNPEKRQKYDALRRYGFGRAGFGGGGAGGQGFPGGPFPGGGIRFETGNLEGFDFADLFADNSPFADYLEQILQQMGAGAGPRTARRASRGSRVHPRFHPRPRTRPAPHLDDPFFRQEGLDVHCTIWLHLDQLEKGAKVKVRTPAGKKALVRIPPGTRIGAVLRLPGQGLASGSATGDQYVHVEAVE